MANYGFVYVLGHDYMPGVFKIGMTNQTPLRRRDELSSGTAIPSPFDLLFYIEVDDAAQVEKDMHECFRDFRISDNREFFQCDVRKLLFEFEQYECDGWPMALTSFGKEALYVAELGGNESDQQAPPEMPNEEPGGS